MIDCDSLAIADVIKHPRLGVVSYQPDLHEQLGHDKIMVRNRNGNAIYVYASECDHCTADEVDDYWKHIKFINFSDDLKPKAMRLIELEDENG